MFDVIVFLADEKEVAKVRLETLLKKIEETDAVVSPDKTLSLMNKANMVAEKIIILERAIRTLKSTSSTAQEKYLSRVAKNRVAGFKQMIEDRLNGD